jgi:hypothetical protein
MHVHRDDPSGKDVEEWYIIIEGAGTMRFTNGDSVEVGPGDLIATYPGTGHSLEATGDKPVKLLAIAPEMFTTGLPPDEWPETWEPRIRVLATTEDKNPTSAECVDCGALWERPEDDFGSNTLPVWAVEHGCRKRVTPVHLGTASDPTRSQSRAG